MTDLKENLVKLDINDLMDCLFEPSIQKKYSPSIETQFKTFVKKTVDLRRKKSSVIAMRDFHNWVKRIMIYVSKNLVYKPQIHLLDIAVGRGGDLDKWNKAGISSVFGFDANEESINSIDPFNAGAKQRLATFGNLKTDVHFEVGNAIQPTMELLTNMDTWLKKHNTPAFQIVSCQFAMHYFFRSKDSLDIVFKIISKYLQVGGYFIGTTLDSEKIRGYFKSRESYFVEKTLFDISINNFFKKTPYGNAYTFSIKDIVDEGNYFNTMGPSLEYLVDFNELNEVAAKYNLVPFKKNIFEPYTSEGKVHFPNIPSNIISFDKIRKLKTYVPKDPSRVFTPEEQELNSLYVTFMFQKVK
jgi:mRNA (guanine-N7-)-methyltransferase